LIIAFVVPAFEVRSETDLPAGKEELLHKWATGEIRPFYSTVCWKCQKQTDYVTWKRYLVIVRPTKKLLLFPESGRVKTISTFTRSRTARMYHLYKSFFSWVARQALHSQMLKVGRKLISLSTKRMGKGVLSLCNQ